jgi:hypothetical protein
MSPAGVSATGVLWSCKPCQPVYGGRGGRETRGGNGEPCPLGVRSNGLLELAIERIGAGSARGLRWDSCTSECDQGLPMLGVFTCSVFRSVTRNKWGGEGVSWASLRALCPVCCGAVLAGGGRPALGAPYVEIALGFLCRRSPKAALARPVNPGKPVLDRCRGGVASYARLPGSDSYSSTLHTQAKAAAD